LRKVARGVGCHVDDKVRGDEANGQVTAALAWEIGEARRRMSWRRRMPLDGSQ
jgi:hypothetical protein